MRRKAQNRVRRPKPGSGPFPGTILLPPPMWTFEQYPPRAIDLAAHPPAPALPAEAPRIAIVTPSYNQARFLDATIDSVLGQNYPNLHNHVQDGASANATLDLRKNRSTRVSCLHKRATS